MKLMQQQEWLDTLIAHELAFGFLGTVFYEAPSATLLQRLADESLFDAWPLESRQPNVELGLATLREFTSAWRSDKLSDLKQDFQALFIGPGELLAVPWESVYRSQDHIIFDVQTIQVRHAYQQFAMPTPWLNVEPDDHIGLEMRFIAHLCALGLAALDQNDAPALERILAECRNFLGEHLLQWGPACLNLVQQHAQTPYYRGCAQLALGCLAHTAGVFDLKFEPAAVP